MAKDTKSPAPKKSHTHLGPKEKGHVLSGCGLKRRSGCARCGCIA